MALTTIASTSQSGSLELLATELKNPPALINDSGSTVTVAIGATGEWSLLDANFVTSDPTIIRYKKPVDGDGLTREKSDEKFKFKYPNLNPGVLIGEIKDAKGNTKSTVSGKQQSFELQPGDSVSFTINDDPQWYGDNAGKLTISYTVTTKTVKVSVLSFDGKDDYVALPAVNNDYSQGFTVEAWVQYSSFKQSWSRIIEFGNGPGRNNIVLGHVGTSKDIGFHLYTTSGLHKIEIANALEIGKWTHIAVTISKSREGKLYQNGQLVQSKPFALPDIIDRKLNYIAKSNWSQDGYFEGEIAEIRVWNIARTPEEIKQNINSRLSGNEPGLVGYYPLNGDTNDKTSKANHGTINGAIWQQGEVHITG